MKASCMLKAFGYNVCAQHTRFGTKLYHTCYQKEMKMYVVQVYSGEVRHWLAAQPEIVNEGDCEGTAEHNDNNKMRLKEIGEKIIYCVYLAQVMKQCVLLVRMVCKLTYWSL